MSRVSAAERSGQSLASELQEARTAFSRAVLKLPTAWKKTLLEGELEGLKADKLWTMRQVEVCFERLVAYRKQHPAASKNADFQEALRQKQRIDRNRDGLISANLRLVAHIAKKFTNQGMSF